ncbi:MAG: hypothetical protein ACT6FF_10190 [Methanosarcinaceae archaeon]
MSKIKKAICVCLILLLLQSTVTSCFAVSNNEPTIYHELVKLEQSELEIIYTNTTLPGFEIYSNAISLIDEYPMYSYTLLSECRKLLIENNTDKFVIDVGGAKAEELLILNIEKNMSLISEKKNNIKPNTIACNEWISLAENNLNMAEQSFVKAKEYKDDDSNATIHLLINTQHSLHKANNLLILAKKRNRLNSTMTPQIITNGERKVALKWIQLANDAIKSNNDINNLEENSNAILKKSQNYFDEENYYLAIMDAVDAKVSKEYIPVTNSSEAIKLANESINDAEIAMSAVYYNPCIDAPLAELKIELAKLHLRDAEKDDTIAASLLAYTSIQEALIAKEQSNAVLELKDAIENPVESTQNPDSKSLSLGLFPLMASIIAYVIRRRQGN